MKKPRKIRKYMTYADYIVRKAPLKKLEALLGLNNKKKVEVK